MGVVTLDTPVLERFMRLPPHIRKYPTENEINLKGAVGRAEVKPKGAALFLQDPLPPETTASTHNYLLFLLKSFMRDLSFVLMKTTIFKVLNCDPEV